LNAETDDDKDDTVNQLTSDVNSWRHCPDCFLSVKWRWRMQLQTL